MSKSMQELELKFSNLDTKIENKIDFVDNLYQEEQRLLNEHFDNDGLLEKYSNKLNDLRIHKLIPQIEANLRLEIDHVNELVRSDGKTDNVQIFLDKLEKRKNLKFNQCVIKPASVCTRRLILK